MDADERSVSCIRRPLSDLQVRSERTTQELRGSPFIFRKNERAANDMKKISLIILLILTGICLISCGDGNSRVTNEEAEEDSKGRYLTIINSTDQVINEVHVTVGAGTEIEDAFQENPDERSFSVEIPESFEEYETFTVSIIDRYGLKYEKEISDVKDKGRTEVEITEDDYVKQDGDFKRKIDRFFNGDS